MYFIWEFLLVIIKPQLNVIWQHQGMWKVTKKTDYSLAVQRLGLRALTAKGPGSVPGQGTKIPQAVQCGQNK